MERVPLAFRTVPGVKGVMERGEWVVEVRWVGSFGFVFGSGPGAKAPTSGGSVAAAEISFPVSGGTDFKTTISMVSPLLSSKVRTVRRWYSVLATITPARQTNWIGWLW